MASYNRIILMGNLTRDPELTYTQSNTAICKFGIATNRKWKSKDGKEGEEACFVDCTLFGKAAETFNQYTQRGASVLIEGRLVLEQWTAQNGQKRTKHAVMVENFTFVGSRGGDGASANATEPVTAVAGPPDDEIPF